MADGYLLTERDRAIMREIVAEVRRTIGNTTGRAGVEWDEHQAPEVYVAKTPSGGIPALANDEPGSAACYVYRIIEGSIGSIGARRIIYNLGSTAVSGDEWIPVIRDKFGAWLVAGGGAGDTGSWATCINDTPAANLYDATLMVENADGSLSATGASIWLRDCNNPGKLRANEVYHCHQTGNTSGRDVYTCDDFNLTVRYSDSTSETHRVQFLSFQIQDFILSSGGARTKEASTRGYTGTVGPYYKYACVGGVLTQYTCNGFGSRRGLVQSNLETYH